MKLIRVILPVNDALMKKRLFNYCKFIAGKSPQCQIETDLGASSIESCWTATKYGQQFEPRAINSFGGEKMKFV